MTASLAPVPAPGASHPRDLLGRPMRDLRISVTDRCNFRCTYCMPKEIFGRDYAFLPHDQILTFEDRRPSDKEEAAWAAGLNLGQQARTEIRGRDLQFYLDDLAGTREGTLRALAGRDDAWLEQPLRAIPEMNAHWAWFHVAEDEISHRGQIRWLRARLPPHESGG